ncbi:hypothetical protein LCGC14_2672460 [marine sediment metagenome]|uniref:Uncharacterized protein n=1 Tax=marine sediment metagenome TaxID=412755 RepID=A0A0F8ZNQ7_9ZZZZ
MTKITVTPLVPEAAEDVARLERLLNARQIQKRLIRQVQEEVHLAIDELLKSGYTCLSDGKIVRLDCQTGQASTS